jgi:hypothetical protein
VSYRVPSTRVTCLAVHTCTDREDGTRYCTVGDALVATCTRYNKQVPDSTELESSTTSTCTRTRRIIALDRDATLVQVILVYARQ